MEPNYEHKPEEKIWEKKIVPEHWSPEVSIEVYTALFREDSGARGHYFEMVVIDNQFDPPAQYRMSFGVDGRKKEYNEWLADVLSHNLAKIVKDSSRNTKKKIARDVTALTNFIGLSQMS